MLRNLMVKDFASRSMSKLDGQGLCLKKRVAKQSKYGYFRYAHSPRHTQPTTTHSARQALVAASAKAVGLKQPLVVLILK